MIMKRKPPVEDGSRTGPCRVVLGCTKTTREHKPACADHLEHLPYVQQLVAVLATEAGPPEIAKVCTECSRPYRVKAGSGGNKSRYCSAVCCMQANYRRRRERARGCA